MADLDKCFAIQAPPFSCSSILNELLGVSSSGPQFVRVNDENICPQSSKNHCHLSGFNQNIIAIFYKSLSTFMVGMWIEKSRRSARRWAFYRWFARFFCSLNWIIFPSNLPHFLARSNVEEEKTFTPLFCDKFWKNLTCPL